MNELMNVYIRHKPITCLHARHNTHSKSENEHDKVQTAVDVGSCFSDVTCCIELFDNIPVKLENAERQDSSYLDVQHQREPCIQHDWPGERGREAGAECTEGENSQKFGERLNWRAVGTSLYT